MEASTHWWIVAAVLVIAELLTGTVYLLTIALGAAAGAMAAHLGAGFATQTIAACAIGAGATLLWHFSKARKNRMSHVPAAKNADVNQDIGAQVLVESWLADGTAQVRYRGSNWTVQSGTEAQRLGLHKVTRVEGNRLIVESV